MTSNDPAHTMTKREHFASTFMAAMLRADVLVSHETTADDARVVAGFAVECADELLRALKGANANDRNETV